MHTHKKSEHPFWLSQFAMEVTSCILSFPPGIARFSLYFSSFSTYTYILFVLLLRNLNFSKIYILLLLSKNVKTFLVYIFVYSILHIHPPNLTPLPFPKNSNHPVISFPPFICTLKERDADVETILVFERQK